MPENPWKKSNPFPATLLKRQMLTAHNSGKQTLHVELSLKSEGAPLLFEPGDSLALVVQNPPKLIEQILERLQLSGEEKVGDSTLFSILKKERTITFLRESMLKKYQKATACAALGALLEGDKEKLKAWLQGRDFLDLLEDFPGKLEPEQIPNILPKLQVRLYSSASSLQLFPEAVHFTVRVICYRFLNRERKGVASSYLDEALKIGDVAWVYPVYNRHFKLPDKDAPLILIGPGTGVAPFRAFLQELSLRAKRPPVWLFFGEQHQASHFYYQKEWEKYLQEDVLTRLSTAFSRDGAEKVYVQHRIKEAGQEIFRWLEQGAYVYVCGGVHMAPRVWEAFLELLGQNLPEKDAALYLEQLQANGRYQRDIY